MSDDTSTTDNMGGSPSEAEHGHHDGKHHKKKVRSAWISFIGRIIAQVSGAAATIVIGLAVLNQYPRDRQKAPDPAPAAVAAPELSPKPAPQGITLAVLPFASLSADPAHGYLADSVSEAIIATLACADGLHVVSRTSTLPYRTATKPLRTIAAELGVAFVVEGAVAIADGRVRVTAQLIDADADREIWARSYDWRFTNVLALQTDVSATIASDIADALNVGQSIRWSPDTDEGCAPPAVGRGGRGGG